MTTAQAAAESKTARNHPWEKVGLGRAPFRCVGMFEDRFDMGGGTWKPGGTCDYCGTGILYVFKCVSSDGKAFKVGSDCIRRCSLPAEEIVQVAKRTLAAHKRAKAGEGRRARQKKEAEERRAAFEAKVEANKKWLATNPLYLRLKAQAPAPESFLAEMMANMEKWGGLTQKQEDAATKMLDRIEQAPARKAASAYLGAVGDRVKIEAVVEFSRCIRYGIEYGETDTHLNKLRTVDGSAVVWFGAYGLKEGATVTGTAKIKKLETYQDERQTTITNPRWK